MKKFETFINDDNRDAASLDLLPKHNPAVDLAAKNYVDDIIKSNDLNLLFKAAGVKPPKNLTSMTMDDVYDEIKQKAIDYYIENPQDIGKDIPQRKVNKGGDGVVRTNNIGGALHSNSPRVGESKNNFDAELEITLDEMSLFNTEESLMNLISTNKIMLGNCVIQFNNNDKQTKQTLDIYFELDEVDPIEETLAYLTHSDTKPSSIIYLGELGLQLDLTGLSNIESLIEIKNQYSEAFLFDMMDIKTEQDLIRKSQSIFQNWGIRTSKNIGEISESTSELLGIANGRFEILTLDMINQDYKVVIDIVKSVSDYILASFSRIEKINRGKGGEISQFTEMDVEEFSKNATHICDIKHDYEGWKELLSNLFEKL